MRENISESLMQFIFVAFILLAAWNAWHRGLTGTLEGETAAMAKSFLSSFDWTVNHFNGMEDYDKPPLFYWVTAFFVSMPGLAVEFAVRLPSLLSVAAILPIFRLLESGEGREDKGGIRVSTLAAVIFIASPNIAWMAQVARIDILFSMLCFSALVSFFLFFKVFHEGKGARTVSYYLFFIFSAVAVMTKGPVALLILVPPVTLFLLISCGLKRTLGFWAGRGTLLMLLISVPWFVVASVVTDGRFFHRFILEENLSRFGNLFSGIEYKTFNRSPVNRYFVYLLTGFFPWSLTLPFLAWNRLRNFFEKESLSTLLMIYVAWIFIFFSLCGVKRSDYILPMYPACAFLVADYMLHLLSFDRLRKMTLSVGGLSIFLLFLTAASSIFCKFNGDAIVPFISSKMDPALVSYFQQVLAGLMPFLIIGFIFYIAMFFYMKKSGSRSTLLTRFSAGLLILYITGFGLINPAVERAKDARPFCSAVKPITDKYPVSFYDFWDEECAFYLNRHIHEMGKKEFQHAMSEDAAPRFFIVRRKDFDTLVKEGTIFPFYTMEKSPLLRPLVLAANFNPFKTKEKTR